MVSHDLHYETHRSGMERELWVHEIFESEGTFSQNVRVVMHHDQLVHVSQQALQLLEKERVS